MEGRGQKSGKKVLEEGAYNLHYALMKVKSTGALLLGLGACALLVSAQCDATNEFGYSTTYKYAGQIEAGSIANQVTNKDARWNGNLGVNTPGTNGQRVLDIGPAAHSGNQVWRYVNFPTLTGSYSDKPGSPELSCYATEPSATNANGSSAFQGADMFEGRVWFKMVSPVADGTDVEVDLGRVRLNGSPDDRGSTCIIRYNGDFDNMASIINYDETDSTIPFPGMKTVIFSGISGTNWHELRTVARFIDGPTNDIVNYYLDGVASTSRIPSRFANANEFPDHENFWTSIKVNACLFVVRRLGSAVSKLSTEGTATTNYYLNTDPQGVYFDDLSYHVYNSATQDVSLAAYSTAFELKDMRRTMLIQMTQTRQTGPAGFSSKKMRRAWYAQDR